jgi:malonate-semialdehyde dehydrogenase (acetylating)/methylmalonate-semialdehyde dehydrogenase
VRRPKPPFRAGGRVSPIVRARAVMRLRDELVKHRVLVETEQERHRRRDEIIVCAMVSPASRERLEEEIDRAVADGARLLFDVRAAVGSAGAPIAWAGTNCSGSVLTLIGIPSLEAAITPINGSEHGSASTIFTQSQSAQAFRHSVEAGMVGVNVEVPAPVAWLSLGGWKGSIDADVHANGRDAVDVETRKKVVTERWS